MRELGLAAYRFSIAWPRVQPGGRGPANERGLDFYRRLVDALLEAGIEPYPTLYHWDLPQALEDAGGWPARDTAYRFADYAGLVHDALGDRVNHWLTLNEPWCAAFLGYGLGRHAPGLHDGRQAVAAAHHLMLAHGLAVARLRATPTPGTELGIVLNLEPHRPASRRAPPTSRRRGSSTGCTTGSSSTRSCAARYPDDVLAHLAPLVDLGHIQDGDLATISTPLDVLGVNYYRPGARRGAHRAGARTGHALAGRRVDRGVAAGGRAHDDGLGGRSRRASRSCCSGSAPSTAGCR